MINTSRRSFFKLGAGAAAAGSLAIASSSPRIIHVRDARDLPFKRFKVFFHGIDVSGACYRAEIYDDGTGKMYCYEKDPGGHFVMDSTGRDVKTFSAVGKVFVSDVPPELEAAEAFAHDRRLSVDEIAKIFQVSIADMTPLNSWKFRPDLLK